MLFEKGAKINRMEAFLIFFPELCTKYQSRFDPTILDDSRNLLFYVNYFS